MQHLETVHYWCRICDRWGRRFSDLEAHYIEEHFWCPICRRPFISAEALVSVRWSLGCFLTIALLTVSSTRKSTSYRRRTARAALKFTCASRTFSPTSREAPAAPRDACCELLRSLMFPDRSATIPVTTCGTTANTVTASSMLSRLCSLTSRFPLSAITSSATGASWRISRHTFCIGCEGSHLGHDGKVQEAGSNSYFQRPVKFQRSYNLFNLPRGVEDKPWNHAHWMHNQSNHSSSTRSSFPSNSTYVVFCFRPRQIHLLHSPQPWTLASRSRASLLSPGLSHCRLNRSIAPTPKLALSLPFDSQEL